MLLTDLRKALIQVKTKVHARRLSYLEELERFAKEEWAWNPQEVCVRLVENYNKPPPAVIQHK